MKPDLEYLLYAVWWASRRDDVAKRTLWELVVTYRKRNIMAQLIRGDVRWGDVLDAHQNVALKVYQKIELLKATRAYPAFESRIVAEEARKWRRLYDHFFPEPVEHVLEQAGGLQ